jgi:two-component system sensor histidine kinase BaeS
VNIFNRFYRTDEARTRNSGGMGLGLAIAREFVLAHNGTLEVDSTPGQGTVFIVELKKKDPHS